MTTVLLTDRDTADVELTFDTLNKARGHARAHDVHRWVAKDTAGITLASWLDPTGKDHESMTTARVERGSLKARPCTTGRLRVTLRVPDTSQHYGHNGLAKAMADHQKLAAEYVKLGAEVTYIGAADPMPAPKPCTPVVETPAPVKVRAERKPAVAKPTDIGSRRRADETDGAYARRRAVETGRVWFVWHASWRNSGKTRVADRAPEGRGWHAYLPDGRDFSCGFGRGSNAAKKVLAEIGTLVSGWRREQAAQAISSPVTVDGSPVEPEGPIYGPTRDDIPAVDARTARKLAAGYGADDTPCEPQRSAYTSDAAGTAAYERARQIWFAWCDTAPLTCEACGSKINVMVHERLGITLCERCTDETDRPAAAWAAPTSAPVYAIDVPMLPTGGATESTVPDAPTLPRPMVDYLSRLLSSTKRDYAQALALHLVAGTPTPARPNADWVDDVTRKVNRYTTIKEISNV